MVKPMIVINETCLTEMRRRTLSRGPEWTRRMERDGVLTFIKQEAPPASQARSRSEGEIGPEKEKSGVTEQGGATESRSAEDTTGVPGASGFLKLLGYADMTSRPKVVLEFVERAARADLEWASVLA